MLTNLILIFNNVASNLVSKSRRSHTRIDKLDLNKSPGIDNIPIKLIKLVSTQIAQPLERIRNDSFSYSCFPDRLKIQNIIPIHKGGSTMNITNYRPISLLPIFSKMFEQIVLKQLLTFIESNNLLFKHQCGFQRNKSTVLTVIDLLNQI